MFSNPLAGLARLQLLTVILTALRPVLSRTITQAIFAVAQAIADVAQLSKDIVWLFF